MSHLRDFRIILLLLSGLFVSCGPALQASLVLDDPLQNSTTGTRAGGTFVTGGWQVGTATDSIYWHVPTITNGAAEFDVRGLNPNECRTGMEDKVELFHMYDYTVGSSDTTYNGGYRDNPFKHFIRKTDCLDTVKVDSMEIVWQIAPNYTEPDTARLSWNAATTYHFREEWATDVSGNAVLKIYRDGVLSDHHLGRRRLQAGWAQRAHRCQPAPRPSGGRAGRGRF